MAVTKLDVALEHVEAAVLMTALDASPRSIHLQVMAAEELIRDVARARGARLALDLDSAIRPEKLTEWRRLLRKSYNYLKHADRDAHEDYSGPDDIGLGGFNDLYIVQSIINLRGFGHSRAALDHFQAGMQLLSPEVMDWDLIKRDHPDLWKQVQSAWRPDFATHANMLAIVLAKMIAEGRVSEKDLRLTLEFSAELR